MIVVRVGDEPSGDPRLTAEGVLLKASAGIRTYADAAALIEAGADRIGTSAGVAIMEGASHES